MTCPEPHEKFTVQVSIALQRPTRRPRFLKHNEENVESMGENQLFSWGHIWWSYGKHIINSDSPPISHVWLPDCWFFCHSSRDPMTGRCIISGDLPSLVGGFNHSEKYEFVNGKDYPIYIYIHIYICIYYGKIIQMFETTNQIRYPAKESFKKHRHYYICYPVIIQKKHTIAHLPFTKCWYFPGIATVESPVLWSYCTLFS